MAAHSLREVREALADCLRAVPDLRVYDSMTSQVSPPAVLVLPDTAELGAMARGLASYVFELRVFTGLANSRTAERQLETLLDLQDADSITGVVHANRSLGLTAADAHVTGWSDYGLATLGDQEHWSASLECVVHITAA